MFKRRKASEAAEPGGSADPTATQAATDASERSGSTGDGGDAVSEEPGDPDTDAEPAEEALSPRPRGPWDAEEAAGSDERLDLGGLRIRGFDGMQMQVQMDESSRAVSLITLSVDGAAVQIQAFAAPKTSGIWVEVRRQLVSSISASGGLVEEAAGEYGVELRAKVPGQGGLQPARFVGVDGPRWFLRGLFLGAAAVPGGSPVLEDAFRDIVVVRGFEAMAPGDLIPMTLPPEAQASPA